MKDRRTKADLLAELETQKRRYLDELAKRELAAEKMQREQSAAERRIQSLESEIEAIKVDSANRLERIKQALHTAAALRYPNCSLVAWEQQPLFHRGRYITLEPEPETEELLLMRLLYQMCE